VLSAVLLAGSRWNHIVMVSAYFPFADTVRLAIACGGCPLFDTPFWRVGAAGDVDGRVRDAIGNMLARPGVRDEFERLVTRLIPANLPRIFVEDFAAAGALVRRWFPHAPRVIVTANAFAYNDLFKRWSAEAVERGVPLALLQHGGSYGCARWNSSEDYEARIADRYYTWGWDDPRPNVVPWSASRLRAHVRGAAQSGGGDILWVVVSFPRYAYTMYSVPSGPQTLAYLDFQERFGRAVSPEVRQLLRYRPYPLQYGWSDYARLRDAIGDIRVAGTIESMQRQLSRSRLFVGTFNATAFLETFVADVPTVLFWDPHLWETRPEATPYFDELRRVGILHDMPESAAAFIETIYLDPGRWWRGGEVQDVVRRFCARFGRVHDRTLDDWRAEFERLALQPRAS
jgi:putative transferase (TIGR04331 family)